MTKEKIEEKIIKNTRKLKKKNIKYYVNALFKRGSDEYIKRCVNVLEDVCYQLYTYGEIMHFGVIKANKIFGSLDEEVVKENDND